MGCQGALTGKSQEDNPVGGFILSKKDIYIIKNDINDKVYIGQTNNPKHRWEQYESAFRHKDKRHLICRAMIKYGIEHFHMEVLEENVENYDEREIYWIKKYDSIVPKGYNLAPGGKGSGCGFENPNAMFTEEEVINIRKDIMYSDMTFTKIAEKYHCNPGMISTINSGDSYFDKTLSYPLKHNRKPKEIVNQVIYALQYELDKSMTAIADEWHFDLSVVYDINIGNLHRIPNKQYPLRSGRVFSTLKDVADDIIKELQETDKQQKDIAKDFSVSTSFVSTINKGIIYRRDDIEYPIRDNYQSGGGGKGRKLLPLEVKEVEDALKNTTRGMRKIAEDFDVSMQTIIAINIGSIKMYRRPNTEYPIRKIQNNSK